MAEYKVQVTGGESGIPDHINVTLFGSTGQTEPTELNRTDEETTGTYMVKTSSSLGKLLLVQLGKDPDLVLTNNKWYCSKIVVWSPEGEVVLFPCYRWISRGDVVALRGGKAMKVFEEDQHLLIDHRNKEMTARKNLYQWKIMAEGLPHICSFSDASDLPAEVCVTKPTTRSNAAVELKLVEQLKSAEKWENIEDLRKIFWYKTTISDYVKEHWRDDDFYGFQFLNGGNPNVIARCSELPPNFPVTDEMVKPFLEKGSSLQQEMEKGNIFLYDQKKMDGIAARVYDGERLHVAAGLCLFYLNSENKLMPIAVQLHQQPSEENPIFLPSDLETDWLLAKMFIKNADAIDHGAVHHFMNTHFLTEVFCVAALRCFPEIHPIYKLLFPHFRDTLHTNIIGRQTVLGPDGPLSISSLGYDGLTELMRRSLSELTYSALCLPENITARGLQSIPNFYYRDDGLKLWAIINSFVKTVVEYYYGSDCEVLKDSELQDWISEIFTHGFLGKKDSGFPAGFDTVEELIKFITMVIFTATAQHAAVNNGQFDYFYWVLNGSLLLHGRPPNTKGQSSMTTILETLPNVGETAMFAVTGWVLSEKDPDMVPLGSYPEERFDELAPKQTIEQFKEKLSVLSEQITTRNSQLEVPYLYLDPPLIQNSITI